MGILLRTLIWVELAHSITQYGRWWAEFVPLAHGVSEFFSLECIQNTIQTVLENGFCVECPLFFVSTAKVTWFRDIYLFTPMKMKCLPPYQLCDQTWQYKWESIWPLSQGCNDQIGDNMIIWCFQMKVGIKPKKLDGIGKGNRSFIHPNRQISCQR